MKKIGIMGGTFNPVHNAHLILAECAYEQFKLDSVWFMPSKNPPHKRNQYIETKEHRSNMIKLALMAILNLSFQILSCQGLV